MKENNKLLDEFLGSEGEYISHKDMRGCEVWGSYEPNKYNSDWNRLMEVVNKIESLEEVISFKISSYVEIEYWTDKGIGLICIADSSYKQEAVYQACVDFVKWYNENK